MHIQINDWRGTPIVPGAIVVYPGRQGSHQWMIEAEVLGFENRDHWGTEQLVLRVQPLRKGAYGRTNMRPVILTALERVTVIPTNNDGIEAKALEAVNESIR